MAGNATTPHVPLPSTSTVAAGEISTGTQIAHLGVESTVVARTGTYSSGGFDMVALVLDRGDGFATPTAFPTDRMFTKA